MVKLAKKLLIPMLEPFNRLASLNYTSDKTRNPIRMFESIWFKLNE